MADLPPTGPTVNNAVLAVGSGCQHSVTAERCDSRDLMKGSVFLCGLRRQSALLLCEDSRRNQVE